VELPLGGSLIALYRAKCVLGFGRRVSLAARFW